MSDKDIRKLLFHRLPMARQIKDVRRQPQIIIIILVRFGARTDPPQTSVEPTSDAPTARSRVPTPVTLISIFNRIYSTKFSFYNQFSVDDLCLI